MKVSGSFTATVDSYVIIISYSSSLNASDHAGEIELFSTAAL